MKKKILWGLLALIVIIQFFRIDKTNPASDPAGDFIAMTNPPSDVADIFKTSCYDCHSFQSEYPWYTNIAPVSWVIKKHINEGREHLNFSVWGDYSQKDKNHKLEELYEEVREGEMPLKSYLILHSDAKLDGIQVEKMTDWLVEIGGEAVKGDGEDEEDEDHDHDD